MGSKINLIGRRYEKLVVMEEAINYEKSGIYWLCKCDCGNEKTVLGKYLKNQDVKSCGCLKLKKNLTGQKFNKLTVKKNLGNDDWECVCDCGKIKITTYNYLKNGAVKSCGCIKNPRIFRNLVGKVVGRLIVIEQDTNTEYKKWICECNCGVKKSFKERDLLKELVESCGCIRKEETFLRRKTERYTKNEAALQVYGRYADGDITFEQFYELSQLECYYCGQSQSNKYTKAKEDKLRLTEEEYENSYFYYNGLDRLNNDVKEHNLDNVVTCCKNCNASKSHKSLDKFIEFTKKQYLTMKDKSFIK